MISHFQRTCLAWLLQLLPGCWRKLILIWQGCCPGKCSAEKYFFNYWGGEEVIFFTQMLNFLELIGYKNAFEASFGPLTAMPRASGWGWILTEFIALYSNGQSQTDSQLSLALLFLPAAFCVYIPSVCSVLYFWTGRHEYKKLCWFPYLCKNYTLSKPGSGPHSPLPDQNLKWMLLQHYVRHMCFVTHGAKQDSREQLQNQFKGWNFRREIFIYKTNVKKIPKEKENMSVLFCVCMFFCWLHKSL